MLDRNRTVRAILVVVTAAILGAACGRKDVILPFTAPPEVNPRIRLDGAGLDPSLGQDTMDPFRGAFRNGEPGSEIVSELFPDLADSEEKLPQSNCFWISNPTVGMGDLVELSWEVVVSIYRPTLNLDCSSPNRVGLCQFRDPVDGRSLVFHDRDDDAPDCPDDGDPPTGDPDHQVGGFAFKFDTPDGTFTWDEVGFETQLLPIYVMEVQEIARAAADPHRACPGDVDTFTPFSGPERPAAFFEGASRCQPSAETGYYLACGRRCSTRPIGGAALEDVTYRLQNARKNLVHDLRPNVMSVQGTTTITRKMELINGNYVWQTEVSPAGGGRWHENFSNLIRVESARVYVLDGGVEKPLALAASSGLGVTGGVPGGPLRTRTCEGGVLGTGTVFPVFTQAVCSPFDELQNPFLLATPTYLHRDLQEATGPLTLPLSWSVTPQGPVIGEVFIELTLVGARKEGMALTISSPHDFGRVPIGEERRLRVVVENIGGEAAVIDDVYLAGSEAADFAFVLPSDPKPLPLPVSGQMMGDWLTLSPSPSLAEGPQLLSVRLDATGTSISLAREEFEGAAQSLNDYTFEVEGGLAFYDDPDAVFRSETLAEGSFEVAMLAFARRTPPFELWPGESFEAMVTAMPAGYNQRWGELHVAAHQLTDPSVEQDFYASLLADGVVAPYLEVVPPALSLPTGSTGSRQWWRAVLVTNPTTFDVERSYEIAGPAAALFEVMGQHDPVLTLEPGGAEVFRVRYMLPCPGPVPPAQPQAELRIHTDHATEVVDLTGFMPPECVAP